MNNETDTSTAGTSERSGARRKAIEAYDRAGTRVGDSLQEAPLIALAGGLAAGALLAALLPRTESETRALRPMGKRLGRSARAAAGAARDAGTSRLEELGLTAEKGMEALRSILEGAGEAAKSSAQAALGSNRKA